MFEKISNFVPKGRIWTYFQRDHANTDNTKTFSFYTYYYLIISPDLYSKL